VVLLALDPWFWNGAWLDHNADEPGEMNTDVNALNIVQRNWLSFATDLITHATPLQTLLRAPGIGLTARIHGGGFRSDGSYDYGWYLSHPDDDRHWDPHFRQTLDRIARGVERFERAAQPDLRGEAALRALLADLHARGATVVAFFPPFAPSVRARMRSLDGYAYMDELPARATAVFAEHGDRFFDFSDPATLGAIDSEFIDGYHGSERTYARLMLRLAEDVPAVASRLARPALADRLAHAARFALPEAGR
jgi:hypothetical protein